jgi:hypothetical protein
MKDKPKKQKLLTNEDKKIFFSVLESKVSDVALSEYTGISATTISTWRANDEVPLYIKPFVDLAKLADSLGVDLANIMKVSHRKKSKIKATKKLKKFK